MHMLAPLRHLLPAVGVFFLRRLRVFESYVDLSVSDVEGESWAFVWRLSRGMWHRPDRRGYSDRVRLLGVLGHVV